MFDFLLCPSQCDVYYPVIHRYDDTLSLLEAQILQAEKTFEQYENDVESCRNSFSFPLLFNKIRKDLNDTKMAHLQSLVAEYLGFPHAYEFVDDLNKFFQELFENLQIEENLQVLKETSRFNEASEQLAELKAEVARLQARSDPGSHRVQVLREIQRRRAALDVLQNQRNYLEDDVSYLQNQIDLLNQRQLERESRKQREQAYQHYLTKMTFMDELYGFTVTKSSDEFQYNFFKCFCIKVVLENQQVLGATTFFHDCGGVDPWLKWKANLIAKRCDAFQLVSKLRTTSDLQINLHHLSVFVKRVDGVISFLESNMEIAGVAPEEGETFTIFTEDSGHGVSHCVIFPFDYPRSPFLLKDGRAFRRMDELIDFISQPQASVE